MRQASLLIINTVVSYGRMAVTLLLSLVATRLLLGRLGFVDYGLLTALGATGLLGPVIVEAMGGASRRFLAYEIGRDDQRRLAAVFHTSLAMYVVLALAFAGLALLLTSPLMHGLTVPPDRVEAARIVYTLVIADFALAVLGGPYHAIIHAHQNLSFLAALATLRGAGILAAVLLLGVVPGDPLVVYAALLVCLRVAEDAAMLAWSWARYPASRPGRWSLDGGLAREMATFGWWSSLGFLAYAARTQGAMVLVNVVFGPVANAGYALALRGAEFIRGLGAQVEAAVQPAMTSALARGDQERFLRLVPLASRLSFAVSLLIFVPMSVEPRALLRLWLGEYPEQAPLLLSAVCAVILPTLIIKGHGMAMVARAELGRLTLVNLGLHGAGIGLAVALLVLFDGQPVWVPLTFLGTMLATVAVYVTWIGRVIGVPPARWWRETALPGALLGLAAVGGAMPSLLLPSGPWRLAAAAVGCGAASAVALWRVGFTPGERRRFRDLASAALLRLRGRGEGEPGA